MTAKDMFGRELAVGDFVVYATISGKSPVQKFASVEVVKSEEKVDVRYEGPYGDRKRIETPYTHWKVGVKEISNGRGFTRWDSFELRRDADGGFVTGEDGRAVRFHKRPRTTYPMVENMVKVEPSNDV